MKISVSPTKLSSNFPGLVPRQTICVNADKIIRNWRFRQNYQPCGLILDFFANLTQLELAVFEILLEVFRFRFFTMSKKPFPIVYTVVQ